jgi:acetyl-CoA carboxylase carboxyl transferase subunit alpha
MDLKFLDFEQPIAELEAKIDELKFVGDDSELNIGEEISRLRRKSDSLTQSIFSKLSAWQIAQLARHPLRPYALDYVELCLSDFQELHGDRMYSDDQSLVGGIGRLEGQPVMVIGHQKGRDTKERVKRNYGMARPEGYRKALRLMRMAEKFHVPVISLIDTPGAYPGMGAEERGQSEAIARNLFVMAGLKTPILSVVIGEGGSGASILWKSAEKAEAAAEALGITAERLLKLGLVDEVVPEPLGGAHRDPKAMAEAVKNALVSALSEVQALSIPELLEQRRNRLGTYGAYSEG